MKKITLYIVIALFITSCESPGEKTAIQQDKSQIEDPLPSWNKGTTKESIIAYVTDVTNTESDNFIPVSERIATFDNDGNLWSEQPAYFQLFFAIDRVKAMASEHPEWENKQPFKAVLEGDMQTLKKMGMKGIGEIMMATHAGNTTEEFDAIVKDWVATAKHPTKNVGFDKLVFQPMLELLQYLRTNDFKTYIVSGGGVDFMRAIVTEVYGIPAEQIIGSRIKTEFDYNNGNPVIKRLPEIDYNDDKEGKPLNIQKIIGKKPVFASGNSDGDLQMLQWAASNKYKSFMLKGELVETIFGNSLEYLNKIGVSIRHYLSIKTYISLFTGFIIWIWLYLIGVQYAVLWGLIAFLLNYIPNIGSLLAAIPTLLFSLIQLGIEGMIWTGICYLVVNTVMGSVVEPKVMGKGLGLSTLVVFLALIFWGFILGPVGMFLSIPLTITIKIILEQNKKTKWIAVMLGTEKETKQMLNDT